MNWQSWLALSLVTLLVAAVVGFRYKKSHSKDSSGCGGNCAGCH